MLRVLGIPFAMATQHPDSVRRITAAEEIDEAVNDLLPLGEGGYGCDEKMIDYEGKLTPYHQPEWVVDVLARSGLTPGEDYLLTLRIPGEGLEDAARQIVVIWSAFMANRRSMMHGGQAVKFIVHPMSGTARELVTVHRRIMRLQRLAEEEIGLRLEEPLKLIPLVEDVVRLIHVDKLMEGLYNNVARAEGLVEEYYRVLLGKSDSALAFGHLASSIALIVALSRLTRWAFEKGVRVYPILGVGKPPFRGHLAPHSVGVFVEQYSGYYTVTIQSALRFDTPREEYAKTLAMLREHVGGEPRALEPGEETLLVNAARLATAEYLKLLARIAPSIVEVASMIPSKRDRLPPEKYGRDLGGAISFAADRELLGVVEKRSLPLPRAIRFTAALYTIGVPPALIGLGRGLERIERELGERTLDLVIRHLPLLRLDTSFEMAWLEQELAETYMGEKALSLYKRDVELAKDYLGVDGQGVNEEYKKILWAIRDRITRNDVEGLVDKAAAMRGFLG